MKRISINPFLFLVAAPLWAQSGPEYKMEIGTGIGIMGYLGDFNESLFKDLQPMRTVLARHSLSPYMGLKMNVSFGKMKGLSADVEAYYLRLASAPYTFDNSLVDVDSTYEYNFLSYDTGRGYRSTQRLSPYTMIGLGTTYINIKGGDRKSVLTVSPPIGLGVKCKANERMNVGLKWTLHFSFNSELDGQKDPYSIKSSGPFENAGSYSTLRLTFFYSFIAKCKTCHNEDE